MATFQPACQRCRRNAATLEILAPGELPHDWRSWQQADKDVFAEHRDDQHWYRRYEGPGGSSGLVGDQITDSQAEALTTELAADPIDATALGLNDNAGYCKTCEAHFCGRCWGPTATGRGYCPAGHSASIDPHWSPPDQ